MPYLSQTFFELVLLLPILVLTRAGRNSRKMGMQKYVGRLKELRRLYRRHSAFWVGLYGQLWVGAIKFWANLADDLMRLKPSKLPYFQKGLRAMSLIQSAL